MKEVNKCKNCNSTLTYIRFKTNERVCRNCGHVEKLKGESGEATNTKSSPSSDSQ